MKTTTDILVTLSVPGFHRWPEAPDHRVYLRERHRHLFKIRVEMSVDHAARAIEFHDVLDFCRGQFGLQAYTKHGMTITVTIRPNPLGGAASVGLSGVEFGTLSCEQIAQALLAVLRAEYSSSRWMAVEVWEDGEAGARVVFDPAEDV